MAQTVELAYGLTGLTATLKLFPLGSDTIANGPSDTLTEQTNRKGVYRATVSETPALVGQYEAYMLDGDGVVLYSGVVELADDTEVHTVGDYVITAPVSVTLSADDIDDIAEGVVDGIGGIGGEHLQTVTVTDAADDAPIQGATVKILSGATLIDIATTNNSGIALVNADAGTYMLTVSHSGLYASSTSTLVVNAPAQVAVELSALFIAVPDLPGPCTGYFLCLGSDNQPEAGVTFSRRMVAGAGLVGYTLDDVIVTFISGVNGMAQDTGLRQEAWYQFKRGTGPWSAAAQAPAATSWALNELLGNP